MTPQFVDLNGDGYNDIVAATFEGTAFLIEGGEKGYQKPKHITDREGDNVRIALFWDDKKSDYVSVDRSPEGETHDSNHHMTSVAVVDWDDDGDFDLVLGAYEGALYLCENEGTKTKPEFATTNQQIKADGKPVVLNGGLATPKICDWNGDGLFDIVCGHSSGSVTWYANNGEKGKPKFATSQILLAAINGSSEEEPVSEADYYASMCVPMVDGNPVGPGRSFHIETIDYDQDGDLDLLVGGSSMMMVKQKLLSEADEKKLDETNLELSKLSQQMEVLLKDVPDEEIDEAFDKPELRKLDRKMEKLYRQMEAFQPEVTEQERVWLYENKQNDATSSSRKALSK